MAEDAADKDVDALIKQMQSTLDKLKAAQRRDVTDEDAEEASEPKNLNEAEKKARRLVGRARQASD